MEENNNQIKVKITIIIVSILIVAVIIGLVIYKETLGNSSNSCGDNAYFTY